MQVLSVLIEQGTLAVGRLETTDNDDLYRILQDFTRNQASFRLKTHQHHP